MGETGGDGPEDAAAGDRRAPRVTLNKEFDTFDAFMHEYVANLSETGAFIRSGAPLPVGTAVNLRFTVFADGIETVEGVGRVVRTQDDPPGMGVVFETVDHYSRGLIERLLTARRPR